MSEQSDSDILGRLSNVLGVPAAPQERSGPVEEEVSPQEAASDEEVEPTETDPTDEPPADEEGEGDPEEPFVELEHLGKRYQVPASLKTAFEANRTQANRIPAELAEMRKILQAERQLLDAEKSFSEDSRTEVEELRTLDARIREFKTIDWQSLETNQLLQYRQMLDTLKDQKAELEGSLSQKKAAFERNRQARQQELVQQGTLYLEKAIPGWNDQVAKEVALFAVTERGYSPEELEIYDPKRVVDLWEAMQYRKLQKTKPGVLNKARKAPPVIKPGSVDSAKATSQDKVQGLRDKVRKTGSVEDAAAWFMARSKSR